MCLMTKCMALLLMFSARAEINYDSSSGEDSRAPREMIYRGRCKRIGLFNGPLKNRALMGYVVETIATDSVLSCTARCLGNGQCHSINLWQTSDNELTCELNNRTMASAGDEKLLPKLGINYYEAVSAPVVLSSCHKNPCKNGGVCQDSCHDNSYKCLCSARFTGKHCETRLIAFNCTSWKNFGYLASSIRLIDPDGAGVMATYCEQNMEGGGWALIQRRFQPFALDFPAQRWNEYENGFGNASSEFWLGLENIYRLSKDGVQLRIKVKQKGGAEKYALYGGFSVTNATTNYRLQLASYAGTLGNRLYGYSHKWHNQRGSQFSTIDRDNDNAPIKCGYGWWFNYCGYANLNNAAPTWSGVSDIVYTEMMVR